MPCCDASRVLEWLHAVQSRVAKSPVHQNFAVASRSNRVRTIGGRQPYDGGSWRDHLRAALGSGVGARAVGYPGSAFVVAWLLLAVSLD